MGEVGPDDEYLLHQIAQPFLRTESTDPGWFERLYFNFHDPQASILGIAGFGIFPNAGIADGYFVVADSSGQRNLRVSKHLKASRLDHTAGPLQLVLEKPLQQWRICLQDTDGLEGDFTFHARTDPFSVGMIHFAKAEDNDTAFQHYYQSGRYEGRLRLDGVDHDIAGWVGQRDHSWGLRRPRERLGLHVWMCGQLSDRVVTLSYNESRDGSVAFSEGAVLYEDRRPPNRVVDVRHQIRLEPDQKVITGGLFELTLEDGQVVSCEITPTISGLWVAGAGYGGWQGQDHGELAVEQEVWPAFSGPALSELPLGTSDLLSWFDVAGERGSGVLEVAVSRSPSYTYRPRW